MDIEETKGRWYDLDRVLLTESSMSSENYMPCYELKEGNEINCRLFNY